MHPGVHIGEVYLCCVAVDFRKQIDGLAALVQGQLDLDPFGDALFVFTNRQRSRVKILYWHRNGFCLWQKRLEKDRFAWPSMRSGGTVTINAKELEWLLDGFDLWANYPHKMLNYQCVT